MWSGSIFKNAMLGGIVFESYSGMIHHLSKNSLSLNSFSSSSLSSVRLCNNGGQVDDDFSRVSIFGHYISGFVTGSIHGLISQMVDIIGTLYHNDKHEVVSLILFPTSLSSYLFFFHTIWHHALSHSLLFGANEFFK
jgi:hypothetical protein